MKVYTGNGDKGETTNLSGQTLSKNDAAIHFIGNADELNAYLGLIKAILSNEDSWQFAWKDACNTIKRIQNNLMKIMTYISSGINSPAAENIDFLNNEIKLLEKEIDKLSNNVPEQKKLIIPGKNIIESHIHIARTIARRTERNYFALNITGETLVGAYLNRLSDYLFILSLQESLINFNFINQITGI